jgi:hypothetical protein
MQFDDIIKVFHSSNQKENLIKKINIVSTNGNFRRSYSVLSPFSKHREGTLTLSPSLCLERGSGGEYKKEKQNDL